MQPLVIAIVGPTGIGKTELALKLARAVPLEIISADSMQIYKGMDIGTAKPSRSDRRKVKHHVFDFLEPSRNYSIYRYRSEALKALQQILKKGKLPVVVGGSGLYLEALFKGLTKYPRPGKSIRENIVCLKQEKDVGKLWEKLNRLDPERAARVDRLNPRRILRALELAMLLRSNGQKQVEELPSLYSQGYKLKVFGLTMARPELYEQVGKRIDAMFRKGWLKEAEGLMRKRLGRTARQAIGYRELFASSLLKKKGAERGKWHDEIEKVRETIKKATRHLVKKQFTWFRHMKGIEWFDVTTERGFKSAEQAILETALNGHAHQS